jgi:two-component system, NarL family, nitrate/nitrite response regulator NarL
MQPHSGRVASQIRVLVADTSRIHTQLLSDALQRDPGLVVITWDGDPLSLIPTTVTRNVDVLAISSTFNGHPLGALEVVRDLHAMRAATKCVVLMDFHEEDPIVQAFRAGARGIFRRDGSVEMFCKCINSVYRGEIWATSQDLAIAIGALTATPLLRAASTNNLNLLSKRELEVVRCVGQGLTNQEIADRMGLSRHTIKNYLFRVFDKLGVSSRVELLFMTLSQGISNPEQRPAFPDVSKKPPENGQFDEPTLAVFEKAAHKGVLGAQLALAQAYLARRAGDDDLINACVWYLVATERIAEARVVVGKMLTARQIDDVQSKASILLAHLKQKAVRTEIGGPISLAKLRPAI